MMGSVIKVRPVTPSSSGAFAQHSRANGKIPLRFWWVIPDRAEAPRKGISRGKRIIIGAGYPGSTAPRSLRGDSAVPIFLIIGRQGSGKRRMSEQQAKP